jgi:hypothetical protein
MASSDSRQETTGPIAREQRSGPEPARPDLSDREAPDAPPGLRAEKERVLRGEPVDEEITNRHGEEEVGNFPQRPQPPRRPPYGDVPEQPSALQSEEERVLRGEPAAEREQLDEWPLPKPEEMVSEDPVSRGGELPGDALARDERIDHDRKDHRSNR